MRTRMVQKILSLRLPRQKADISYILIFLFLSFIVSFESYGANATGRSLQKNSRKPANKVHAKTQTSGPGANSAKSKKLTASGLYERAKDYFAAGRYAEAIQYAAAAQRRTSASRLPTILMCRSYYRLGNISRAAKLFRSVPLAEIPSEAAFEYLLTMFAAGRYTDVIKAYSIVPDNHPYRDVAKFYLGSSFLQLKLYQKASAALRSAKKLPISLRSERRQLLSYIKDYRQAEAQGQFVQTPQYYNFGQTSYLPPPVEALPYTPVLPGGVPGKAPPPKPAPPKEGFSYRLTPRFSLANKSTKDDYNGYDLRQKVESNLSLAVDLGLKYLGAPRSFGAQPSLDLVFTPLIGAPEERTTTSKLTADTSNPSNVQNITTRSESKSDVLEQNLSLVGMFPLNDPLDASASFSHQSKTVKSEKNTESKNSTYGAKLSGDFDALDFSIEHSLSSTAPVGQKQQSSGTSKLGASYNAEESTASFSATMTSNSPSNKGIKEGLNLELSWERPFGDFSFEIAGIQSDLSREALSAENQILSQTTLKTEVGYSLGVGLTVTLTGSLSQLAKIPILKDDTITDGPDEVLGSGTSKQLVILVKYAPVSFASASLSYDTTERELKVSNENFKLKMLKSMWSQRTVTAVNLGLNYSF